MRFRRSHLTSQCSRMCSANRQPRSYHRTGHGIVPLTCCLELYSPRVEYTLSILEHKAMEDYIKEALQQQFIRPSTSPAASSFFFVGKKDGGLRLCIDYRTLNYHTVKLPYPLPLVPVALQGSPWGSHLLEAGPAEHL